MRYFPDLKINFQKFPRFLKQAALRRTHIPAVPLDLSFKKALPQKLIS